MVSNPDAEWERFSLGATTQFALFCVNEPGQRIDFADGVSGAFAVAKTFRSVKNILEAAREPYRELPEELEAVVLIFVYNHSHRLPLATIPIALNGMKIVISLHCKIAAIL